MSGPVVLVILDGFGLGEGGADDATAVARAPFFERIRREHPMARIVTSGEAVGLPQGQMGNSEVGHMTLGAGRVIDVDITRISKALAAGAASSNPVLVEAFEQAARPGRRLHLLGLLSDGGVHSHLEHLRALLAECGRRQIQPLLHVFLDGRDTPPRSGLGYLREILPDLEAVGGQVASVSGRYWAMDRDQRWDRVGRAYHNLVAAEGERAPDGVRAVEAAYARDEDDEFVQPTWIEGSPPLADDDVVIFWNFRADRARELTSALTGACAERFEGELERKTVVKLSRFVCFTEYDADFGLPVAFPSERPKRILGELLAERGLAQLRIAETEKYAHVTYFFNCGREEPFPGEDRVLIPSPRDVPTYDHKPEMSAVELTDTLLQRFDAQDYDFVLLNFANPDMVGHTGDLAAAVQAVETIDACLERISRAVLERGGQLLISADHGNCEQMLDPTSGGPHTAHTTNPVPLWWINAESSERRSLQDGSLADLAPTVLALLELPAPPEMSGHALTEPARNR